MALTALVISVGDTSAQGLPPGPFVYSGTATVAGVARAGRPYHLRPYRRVPVGSRRGFRGKYDFLSVSPGDASFANQTITFYLDGLQGDQTDVYMPAGFPTLNLNFPLTFSAIPTPTPGPTAEPTGDPHPDQHAGGRVPDDVRVRDRRDLRSAGARGRRADGQGWRHLPVGAGCDRRRWLLPRPGGRSAGYKPDWLPHLLLPGRSVRGPHEGDLRERRRRA